ncbi:SpoIIE family protein phosphatase [Geodermatophilus sp. URMC 64]
MGGRTPEPDGSGEAGRQATSLAAELAATSAGVGTFTWDLDTGAFDWDDRLLALFGYDRRIHGSQDVAAFESRLHPEDLTRLRRLVRTAIDTCGDFDALCRIRGVHGETRWISARGRAVCGAHGGATRLLAAARDVTAERTREPTIGRVPGSIAVDAATARLRLILQVGAELAGTMDATVVAERLPRLVVPALADGCVVTVIDARGVPDAVGSWHADPARRAPLAEYARERRGVLAGISGLQPSWHTGARAVTSGAEALEDLPQGRARELFAALAPASVMVVPMRAGGRILGVLTLFYDSGEPDAEGTATAQEIADRAGLSLGQARLYDQQHQVAEQLQRSMLTAPQQPKGAEIAVRYLPATEAAAVGGDWYDAFPLADGSTMLVIGDVTGHDTAAAATMGQLRSLLRGIATTLDEATPAAVLTKLDRAMRLLDIDTLATAAVVRLERAPDGGSVLRWSSAGHLPPAVLSPAGDSRWLTGVPGPMLGLGLGHPRHDAVAEVEPGSTVLLYTDGLVERRHVGLDAGLARLQEALSGLADRPPTQLCDELLRRLVPGHPVDDVAVLAVRLHPHDASG